MIEIVAWVALGVAIGVWIAMFWVYFKLEEYVKMTKKVKEVQDYLKENGVIVSEVAIINAAIDIARRISGMEDWVFVREFQEKQKKNE